MSKQKGHRMLVLTNAQGKIIGAAGFAPSKKGEMNTGIHPLPGQLLHEVEVPDDVFKLLSSPLALHQLLSDYHVVTEAGVLKKRRRA